MENQIKFGTLNTNGKLTDVRLIKQSDIRKCPFFILVADHYREDGTCKCNDPVYRKTVMKKWGYMRKHFIRAGIVKRGEVKNNDL